MPERKKKPQLTKTINYDIDIAPYQFIKIFAGVGSGKNYFVDRLLDGTEIRHADGSLVEKQHILLITSRKSKVDEQLKSENVVYDPEIGVFDSIGGSWLMYEEKYADYYESPTKELPDLDGWGGGKIVLRSCVNTNARIEWNLRENYHPTAPESHPWERFDMIVIDEVHSVLADASYQSAPFYVRRLIEETLTHSTTCKVIVMTGTPQVLEKHPLFEKAHLIDRMDTCLTVQPKSIKVITKQEAKVIQSDMLNSKQKFVAFYNHVDDAVKLAKEHPESVAASFSKAKSRSELKKVCPAAFEIMSQTEQFIAENRQLPSKILGFSSTAKNKEGINIENDDISAMFVESHERDEIIQMVGRVRNPVEILYIVMDSVQHIDRESPLRFPVSVFSISPIFKICTRTPRSNKE